MGKVLSQSSAPLRTKKVSAGGSGLASQSQGSPLAFKVKAPTGAKNGVGKQQPLGLTVMPPIGDGAKAEVQKIIEGHDIVVFSKSWCPFCTKVSGMESVCSLATALYTNLNTTNSLVERCPRPFFFSFK